MARHLFIRMPGDDWVDRGPQTDLLSISGCDHQDGRERDLINVLLMADNTLPPDQVPQYEFRTVAD